ncbi:MAG: glycosyltransferase family 2 protein [Acidimicrobiia bacterium]
MTAAVALSVVIPVFNAEQTLSELAARLANVLSAGDEVIFVEDVGSDGSWDVIAAVVAEHPTWRGIQLGRNSGQHGALLAGIRAARNPIIVTMDDDLQHRPEDLPRLLEALTPATDLVYGVSAVEEHAAGRSLASRLVKRILRRSLGVSHAEYISAFRCFRTQLREAFATVNDPYVSIDVLLSWSTSRVTPVSVEMDARASGSSGYSFRGLVRHAVNMITGYSAAPLRVVAYLGLLLGALGMGTLTYVLVRFFLGDTTVPGFTFLASLLSLVGGIQMIGIAVIGEYLARVHFRTMRRPSYFVRNEVGSNEAGGSHGD